MKAAGSRLFLFFYAFPETNTTHEPLKLFYKCVSIGYKVCETRADGLLPGSKVVVVVVFSLCIMQ